MERITSIRIQARNNYSLRNEQNITIKRWENAGCTRAACAMALDWAAQEAVERRGYSGTGAAARVLISVDGEDAEEELTSMSDPRVQALPAGSRLAVREHRSWQEGSGVWDGHNHVIVPATNCAEYLRASVAVG